VEQWYDARGRVWKQRVRTASDSTESESLYAWDTASNGRGQLAAESISGTYGGWSGQSGTALNFSRQHSYDALGRLSATTTVIDGVSYLQSIQYDAQGRAWNTQDASGRWARTQYNARGQPVALCESSQTATASPCPANPNTYLALLDTDARGRPIKERRGNSSAMEVTRRYGARNGRAQSICAGQSGNCQLVNEAYIWDPAGNLHLRVKDNRYQEEFTYDALNRLTTGKVIVHNGVTSSITTVHNTYDRLGNICTSLTGDYTYQGRSGCGIDTSHGSGGSGLTGTHRVSQIIKNGAITSYHYDPRGNQTLRDAPGTANDRTIRYTLDDHAHEIQQGSDKTRFWYGPDGQRYKREDGGKRTLYLGNVEIETNAGVSTIKRTLGGILLQTITGSTVTSHYLFHDVLGSLVRTTNASGTVIDVLDYHPFGARRTPGDPAAVPANGPALTQRGFTGHEHVGGAGLSVIHMNGRIFDPTLGRFLQTDPLVQAPHNLQSWNPYTYVFNNPLTYTDPTGFFSIKKLFKTALAIAISVYTGGAAAGLWTFMGASLSAGQALAVAMMGGLLSGGIGTGTWRGAIVGAFGAGAFLGVGRWAGALGVGAGTRTGMHAMTGGVLEHLQGGRFGHGFVSAGLSKLAMPAINTGRVYTDAMLVALTGGAISRITGGKFANGASTAAMQFAFNQLGQRAAKNNVEVPVYSEDDQERLGKYVEIGDIPKLVDAAISATSNAQFTLGQAGLNVNRETRYILTANGWVDMQHVVSAAFSPGAGNGLSVLMGFVVETAQFFKYPDSAWRAEDILSNNIGATAAMLRNVSQSNVYGRYRTMGGTVGAVIRTYHPYSKDDALKILSKGG